MRRVNSLSKVPLLVLLSVLPGCSAPPAQDAGGASAYAVGDRGSFAFAPIVVSMPFRGANSPYQNLHIELAALVNPRDPKWHHPHEVEHLLRRAEARAAAKLSESFVKAGEQSLDATAALRKKAADETQAMVNELLRAWKDGDQYRVEIVVTNLYWTDASVGK